MSALQRGRARESNARPKDWHRVSPVLNRLLGLRMPRLSRWREKEPRALDEKEDQMTTTFLCGCSVDLGPIPGDPEGLHWCVDHRPKIIDGKIMQTPWPLVEFVSDESWKESTDVVLPTECRQCKETN